MGISGQEASGQRYPPLSCAAATGISDSAAPRSRRPLPGRVSGARPRSAVRHASRGPRRAPVAAPGSRAAGWGRGGPARRGAGGAAGKRRLGQALEELDERPCPRLGTSGPGTECCDLRRSR